MYQYFKGKVSEINDNFIIFEVNNIGYKILVSNPHNFPLDKEMKIYLFHYIREDDEFLVGFESKEEKEVFMLLLKVKGLGPKTIINIFKKATPNQVLNAISANNVAYLKSLPGLGNKIASQIILDLKGVLTGSKGNPKQYEEVYDALKELGFKGKEIDKVLSSINETDLTLEETLKLALTKLRK